MRRWHTGLEVTNTLHISILYISHCVHCRNTFKRLKFKLFRGVCKPLKLLHIKTTTFTYNSLYALYLKSLNFISIAFFFRGVELRWVLFSIIIVISLVLLSLYIIYSLRPKTLSWYYGFIGMTSRILSLRYFLGYMLCLLGFNIFLKLLSENIFVILELFLWKSCNGNIFILLLLPEQACTVFFEEIFIFWKIYDNILCSSLVIKYFSYRYAIDKQY